MAHIRTYELPCCWVHEHDIWIHTVHKADNSQSVFAPPKGDQAFIDAAHEMGYSDLMRYAVEHELAHQITALERGLRHSYVVWLAAHDQKPTIDDPLVSEEEHLANQLQRFCNLGLEDSYGCLRRTYGNRLDKVAWRLIRVARPWLDV